MNFGGKSKPYGSLGIHVERAYPRRNLFQRITAALKGAIARWH